MNRKLVLATAAMAFLALGACNQKPAADAPASGQASTAVQQDRCARGGMEAANDPSCKAAADQRFDKFINGGGDEHRRR